MMAPVLAGWTIPPFRIPLDLEEHGWKHNNNKKTEIPGHQNVSYYYGKNR
jgi:hypothetical protein